MAPWPMRPSTGPAAKSGLERIKKFANREAYAFEELVAEIGACFLGAQIGVAPEFDQSAAYVEGWLKGTQRRQAGDFPGRVRSAKSSRLCFASDGGSRGGCSID